METEMNLPVGDLPICNSLNSRRHGHCVPPCSKAVRLLRWGNVSDAGARLETSVTALETNPIYQSLIAVGSVSGSLTLFKNECSSQASVNRNMSPDVVLRGDGGAQRTVVTSLRFLEEHVLVSGSLDGLLRVWDCSGVSCSEVLAVQAREGVASMVIPENMGEGGVVVTGSQNGGINLRDLRLFKGEGDKGIKSHKSGVISLAVRNGFCLFSGDSSGCVEMRDLRSLRAAPILKLNGDVSVSVSRQAGSIAFIEKTVKKTRSGITEDMWDVAMGRPQVKRKGRTDFQTRETAVPSMSTVNAHSGRIVGIFPFEPCSVLTVGGGDKSVKKFCSVSGNLLSLSAILRDTPLSCAYLNETLFIGDRNGLQIFSLENSGERLRRMDGVSNPHAGAITSVCASGDWGFCTGGKDMHVFLHALD